MKPLKLPLGIGKKKKANDELPSSDENPLIEKTVTKPNNKKIKPALDMSKAERYATDYKEGLSEEQLKERRENGYINVLAKKKGRSYGRIIVDNVFTFFNILTFAVAIALIYAGAQPSQLFFLIIIVANILIGIIQEVRSKRTIDKLSLITAPTAQVIRGGTQSTVSTSDLVLDDVVKLEMGNQICSDSILLVGECEVNESVITGESVAVRKKAGDILYSGSYISSGSCYARVDKVGADNYIETLSSNAKRYKKPRSELKNSITFLIKIVTVFIIPISLLMIIFGITGGDSGSITTDDIKATINTTSGAIIGMIPAGMFLLTSMALAIGVIRLAKRHALVQDLYCIEMLARVDVLCLDKTGTLTDGTMRVKEVVPLCETQYKINEVVASMIAATGDNNQTAIALGQEFSSTSKYKPLATLPFSSRRKLSAVEFEGCGTFALGAPEFVIKTKNPILETLVNEKAAQGLRMVVIAHSDAHLDTDVPLDMEPLFLVAIEDHIREDAIDTINWFKENDVKIKIISGDNPITVAEVAKRVGVDDADKYISLDGLSSQEVLEVANQYTVFGRVTPEQKCLLIRAQKSKGHTVAMMGDGVNDILAMREADCSVSIAAGSEAARNVSHLVLLDNNFSSMPNVVLEGRRVVNNITKSASLFLMKTFMSIILSIMCVLAGVAYPLKTNNLLLLEVFVIGLPSFFLALQANKQRIQGNFLANVVSRAIPGGLALVLNVVAMYLFVGLLNRHYGPGVADALYVTIISPEMYTSMLVLVLAWTGIMVLAKICEPFNAYRIFLLTLTSIMMLLAIILMGSALDIVPMDIDDPVHLACILFMIGDVLITYFVVSMVMKALTTANIMTE